MRVFYEPTTLAIAVAGAQLASGVSGAFGASREAEAAARDERVQAERDIRDEQVARRRQLARQRAGLAAQGVDLGDVQGVLTETRRESLLREGRRRVDSRTRQRSIRRRGRQEATGQLFGGVARAGTSLLRGGVI